MDGRQLSISARQVKRGAELLDEHMPGWRDKINLRTFKIADPKVCILGQLYNSYHKALEELGLGCDIEDVELDDTETDHAPSYFGFDACTKGVDFDDLQTRWLDEIRKGNR